MGREISNTRALALLTVVAAFACLWASSLAAPAAASDCEICDAYTLDIPPADGNDGRGGPTGGGGSNDPAPDAPATVAPSAPVTPVTPVAPGTPTEDDKAAGRAERLKRDADRARDLAAAATPVREVGALSEPATSEAAPEADAAPGTELQFEEQSTAGAAFDALSEPQTLLLLAAMLGAGAMTARAGRRGNED